MINLKVKLIKPYLSEQILHERSVTGSIGYMLFALARLL